MGVLQRFWTKHRLATVLCLALLFLGLLLQPWSLVLVLVVSFGGPLLKRLESFKASPINSWRRDHWIGVALGLSTTEAENNTEPPEPLVGAELLAKVKELGDVGKSDLVRACGYFSIKEDGGERINFTGFYEALLEAKGVDMSTNTADSDDCEESESSDEEPINLPSDWKDLESHEIVDRLRDSVEVRPDVLTSLASSEDWTVRQAVAWHCNTPDDVVKKLADDDDSDVSQATRDRKLPKTWRFMDRDEKIEALKSDDVPSEIIESLASSEDWRLRQAVAWSPSAPESTLTRLKEDEDDDIKEAVITERKLPIDWRFMSGWDKAERLREESPELTILEILAQSRDSDVRRAVALHPTTPERLLSALREDNDDSVQSGIRERDLPDEWKQLSEDEKVEKLNERAAPEDVLNILSQSGQWLVRQAVAQNPGTGEDILKFIIENDGDDDVVKAAKKTLRKISGDGDQAEDEEKTIYIKTEPGGHVLFGKLSEEQVDELRICIDNQELSEELSEIGDNSYGQLAECDGVVNSGDEGDFGNEGTITYSTNQPVLGPEVNDEGTYEDGVYVVVMKLSKCSIEFEFNAEGGFDEDEFEEISVPVRIPEEIEHGLYGHPDFNIITGFKFRGEDVEEYEGEVEDRGYDVQLTFFAIKDGETHNLYSNYNGEEDWQDPETSQKILAYNKSESGTSENNSGELKEAGNTENQKLNSLAIRNGTGAFATKITKSKINKPDSDGDVSIDIELKLTSFSDEDIELVLTKMVVLTANGLPLIEQEDERELLINNASTEELGLNSGYFKAAQIAGSSASDSQVLLQVVPCGCKYTELPLLELTSPGNITGLSEKVELQRDVQLQGFSVCTTKPDEEGNCQLEVKGLIVNESGCLLNKVVVKIRLLDKNGREIDSTEWNEKVPPSGTICVDTSMWGIKPSRLDGARANISTQIFSSLGSHELSWSVGSKPVPIEADMSQVGNVKNNTKEEFNANLAVADRASELPLKGIQSESCSEFDLEIESAKYRAPDSDGETSYEIEYNIKNRTNKAIELLLTRLFILHKSGLIVAATENESEDMAENGESISSSISSWGVSVNELDGVPDAVQLMLQATACSCFYRELGSIDCPRGGNTKALFPMNEEETQLSVEALSIATDPSDDGECVINIKALVKNNTTQSFPRLVLSTKLISASGRELEDTYTQEEIPPNGQIVIEDSLWGIKENRLNSAKLQFSLKSFAATGSCTFITKELSLED